MKSEQVDSFNNILHTIETIIIYSYHTLLTA